MKIRGPQLWNSDMTKSQGLISQFLLNFLLVYVVKNQDQHDQIHDYHNTETNLGRLISCRSQSRTFIGLGIQNLNTSKLFCYTSKGKIKSQFNKQIGRYVINIEVYL